MEARRKITYVMQWEREKGKGKENANNISNMNNVRRRQINEDDE